MSPKNPYKYLKTSPEIIQLAVWMYVRFPLSLCYVEDLLQERGIDICPETIRVWVKRFGNPPAALIVISVMFFTAPLGAKLAHRFDAAKLKRYFSIFIAVVAMNMIFKALG